MTKSRYRGVIAIKRQCEFQNLIKFIFANSMDGEAGIGRLIFFFCYFLNEIFFMLICRVSLTKKKPMFATTCTTNSKIKFENLSTTKARVSQKENNLIKVNAFAFIKV